MTSLIFKREPLTAEEAEKLASACSDQKEKLVVWTLLDTGLRVEELCSLTANNIDWQSHQLVIHGKGSKGRGKKRRVVPMTVRVRTLLEAWFTVHETFVLKKRAVQLMIRRIAKKAEIRRHCSPHVLRHTFSVECIKKGISFPALQAILGHEHLSTTFIYSKMQPEVALDEFRKKF